ncbi:MAG: hypothetical protein H6727_03865 [Myxococcales bacterium]|nr:hypothetical protein [Myxococcales bacterium]
MTLFFHGLEISPSPKQTFTSASMMFRLQSSLPEETPKEPQLTPNLLVQIKMLSSSSGIEQLAQDIQQDIQKTGRALVSEQTLVPFQFADQVTGRLLSFCFRFRGMALRQLQAIRLDGKRLTHLTLTTHAEPWDEATQQRYLDTLASTQTIPPKH